MYVHVVQQSQTSVHSSHQTLYDNYPLVPKSMAYPSLHKHSFQSHRCMGVKPSLCHFSHSGGEPESCWMHTSKDWWLLMNKCLHQLIVSIWSICIFANPLLIIILMQHQAFYYNVYLPLLLSHGLNLIGQICSVICTNLLLCIILLPDPSLTNSIHVQRWPTHALLVPDRDGRGNCHCLCTKIQPVSNSHMLCNLVKIDNYTLFLWYLVLEVLLLLGAHADNCHCLCSKIQPVSNSHTVCNLLKNR